MNNTCLTFKLSLLLMFSFSQSSNADGVYGKENAKIYEVPETLKTLFKYTNSKYWLFTPATLKKGELAPLIINLHGGGQRGNNIEKLKYRGNLFASAPSLGFITAVPQCLKTPKDPDGRKRPWDPKELNQWLEHMKKVHPIDPNRVYLMGFSMGGYGTWVWAANHPEQFAAISPNAGGLSDKGPKEISNDIDEWAQNLAAVPTWAIHGKLDKIVTYERSILMINTIKKYNPVDARLSILEDQKHSGIITQIVNKDDTLLKWYLSHTKK